ncbi:MAG: macro domain-containing protein [Thermodesulfobacteriota bacterium]|jgi:putative ATPase
MSRLIVSHQLPSGHTLTLYQGDLTEEHVDAIVNAANAHLAHGGGLAGAIVRRGGQEIQEESDAWVRQHGPAGHEKPALTGAGRLPARWIIHAVGPVWGSGDEDRKLRAAYTSALRLAHDKGFSTVAFPSISTGIFGFPVERAAAIALQAVIDFCAAHPDSPPREIRFTLLDSPTVEVFRAEFEKRLPPRPR